MYEIILYFTFLFVGAAAGLLPFFIGRATNKPRLGRMGLIWTAVSGLLLLQFVTAIVFTIIILSRKNDCGMAPPSQPVPSPAPPPPPRVDTLGVTCLSGSLKGRTYSVDISGLIIGRETDCAIRYVSDNAGISRHHCSLTWVNGQLFLTDLGSTYGTYMSDGRRLAAQSPVALSVGTRFYLASANNLFQIIIQV